MEDLRGNQKTYIRVVRSQRLTVYGDVHPSFDNTRLSFACGLSVSLLLVPPKTSDRLY